MASPMLPGQPESRAGRWWRGARLWWQGRNWRTFRLAAPAVVVGVGVLVLVCVCAAQTPRELQARYLTEGKRAFEAKDYPRAMSCYERVAPVAEDPDAFYRLALAADATGDPGRAAALMRGLALEDGPGYAPAHFWWAQRYIAAASDTKGGAEARQFRSRAEAHLVRALDGNIGGNRAVALRQLGQLYLIGGRLDDAERNLTQAVQSITEVHFDLAHLYAARKNPTRARQEAEQAARHFRELAKADLNNHTARLAWADATAFLEDFTGSAAVLEEGLAATGAPVYRAALARMYAGWHDVRKKQTAPPGELLGLLSKGLGYESGNRELLNRLLEHLRVGGPEADKARETLRGLLAKGTDAAAQVHFALAVDARMRNDPAAEQLHLEMALAADPKAGTIANNLAYVLSQPPNPDLPRALATVNLALEREPNNPVFRDTRGHIHLGMGRWKEAVADLEFVLPGSKDAEGIHTALATAYDNLHQKELADEHRRLAAAARKPPAKP